MILVKCYCLPVIQQRLDEYLFRFESFYFGLLSDEDLNCLIGDFHYRYDLLAVMSLRLPDWLLDRHCDNWIYHIPNHNIVDSMLFIEDFRFMRFCNWWNCAAAKVVCRYGLDPIADNLFLDYHDLVKFVLFRDFDNCLF